MKLTKFQKFDKLIDIPIEALIASDTKCVMIDMDSTLLVWHGKEIGVDERSWCEEVMDNDIEVIIVSNAKHHRTSKIAAQMDLKFIAPAMKPFPFGLWRATKLCGANRKHSVMIGDQLVTDKIAAQLAGIKFILVEPLSNVEFGLTKFNRKLEKLLFGRDTDK